MELQKVKTEIKEIIQQFEYTPLNFSKIIQITHKLNSNTEFDTIESENDVDHTDICAAQLIKKTLQQCIQRLPEPSNKLAYLKNKFQAMKNPNSVIYDEYNDMKLLNSELSFLRRLINCYQIKDTNLTVALLQRQVYDTAQQINLYSDQNCKLKSELTLLQYKFDNQCNIDKQKDQQINQLNKQLSYKAQLHNQQLQEFRELEHTHRMKMEAQSQEHETQIQQLQQQIQSQNTNFQKHYEQQQKEIQMQKQQQQQIVQDKIVHQKQLLTQIEIMRKDNQFLQERAQEDKIILERVNSDVMQLRQQIVQQKQNYLEEILELQNAIKELNTEQCTKMSEFVDTQGVKNDQYVNDDNYYKLIINKENKYLKAQLNENSQQLKTYTDQCQKQQQQINTLLKIRQENEINIKFLQREFTELQKNQKESLEQSNDQQLLQAQKNMIISLQAELKTLKEQQKQNNNQQNSILQAQQTIQLSNIQEPSKSPSKKNTIKEEHKLSDLDKENKFLNNENNRLRTQLIKLKEKLLENELLYGTSQIKNNELSRQGSKANKTNFLAPLQQFQHATDTQRKIRKE